MNKQYDEFAYLAALMLLTEHANESGYKISEEDSQKLIDYTNGQEKQANTEDNFTVNCLNYLSTKLYVPQSLITFYGENK